MRKLRKLTLPLVGLLLLSLPMAVSAQFTIEGGLASEFNLGEADLKETVINIIQWVLGILALVAVFMVIIGGFQWMTAAGNEERVDKAKKIISAAVIGLIIVLLAWAIVIFVAGTTVNVTR